MFYAFGGSKTLAQRIFFIMILTWDIQTHWQAPKKTKKNKPLDALNIDRHQKKKKQQLLRSGPIVPGNFSFFLVFVQVWCIQWLVFFFFLVPVQVWWLWHHKTLTGTTKITKKQTTRCTTHLQAPKKTKKTKIQQLLKSGPIVPGNFSFFVFFVFVQVWCIQWFFCFVFFWVPVQVWWLWLHKTLTSTKKKKKNKNTRCTKHRQAPKKTQKTKNPATTQKWTHSSWKIYFFLFFWCLCRFGDFDFTKHWQAPKTKKTNH